MKRHRECGTCHILGNTFWGKIFDWILPRRRVVGHLKEIACAVVGFEHAHHVVVTERTGAAAAENGDLVAAFVGGPVAVEPF